MGCCFVLEGKASFVFDTHDHKLNIIKISFDIDSLKQRLCSDTLVLNGQGLKFGKHFGKISITQF